MNSDTSETENEKSNVAAAHLTRLRKPRYYYKLFVEWGGTPKKLFPFLGNCGSLSGPGSEDHDGRGAMREDAAIAREQFCFGGDDLAALGHDAALGAHEAGVQRDRAREVSFGLDGGVARACREQRVGGASGCAIDQRERPTAVNRAVRIEYVRAGFAFEHGEAIADFDEAERQRLRDRRPGDTTVYHCL